MSYIEKHVCRVIREVLRREFVHYQSLFQGKLAFVLIFEFGGKPQGLGKFW